MEGDTRTVMHPRESGEIERNTIDGKLASSALTNYKQNVSRWRRRGYTAVSVGTVTVTLLLRVTSRVIDVDLFSPYAVQGHSVPD